VSGLGYTGVLVAIWVLLWGELTVANLASGIVVALVLSVVVPGGRGRARLPVVRPVALARLGGYLLVQLVVSNWVLTREVLARRSRIRTGVVVVPLTGCSDELLTLITNFVTLTPGTAPVDVERDPPSMSVHVLHLDDVEEVRRDIWRLRDLTVRAFGSRAAIAALAEPVRTVEEGTR
jgi:multicomponent Na+:H+ antiporter subunit E